MIPFQDLSRQLDELRADIEAAIRSVLEGNRFILGPELAEFEREFAEYLGHGQAVGVASGTDALLLSLKALGIGEGDEVVTTPLTAVPTTMAILLAGARPVFVDVEQDGYGMDAAEAAQAVSRRTRAIIPVHLYGQSLDIAKLCDTACALGLPLIEDACQAHGACFGKRRVGTFGTAGCFSFYPTKNLGAYGDAGLVATTDPYLAERVRMLRDYGRTGRDTFAQIGRNSRLDEMQAAILRVKLRRLDQWNAERRRLAAIYLEELEELPLRLPVGRGRRGHVYHLFVVATPRRDELQAWLRSRGVETHVHYPVPVHLQPAMAFLGYKKGSLPRAEEAARSVLSLPLYAGMPEADVRRVAAEVRAFYEGPGHA